MLSNSDVIFNKYNLNGYNLETVDNLFSLDVRHKYYNFFIESKFKIGWSDTTEIEALHYKSLYSLYNEEDLNKLEFAKDLLYTEFGKRIFSNYNISRCVVNLSKPGDFYFNHTHSNEKVLLYYANLRWHEEWSGETLFYNNNMQEILFASPYLPGRLILFDGKLPHTIRSQSSIAPQYRFSFTMFLTEK